MFKLNLKIALRNLWKNKGYTLINILGLSIGMASCILIFIFINYQMSYDKGYKNGNRIYRVVSEWKYADGNDFYSQGVPRPLAPAVRNDFSQYLEKVSAIQGSGGIIKINDANGKERLKTAEDVLYIEPDFFDIFDFKWLAGNAQALKDPNTTVLSKKMANRFFGNWQNAVGKSFNYQNDINYKVVGVIDDVPENSSNPLTIVLSYKNYKSKDLANWGSVASSSECFVLLKKGFDISSLDAPMSKFLAKYYTEKAPGKESHVFQPLNQIHYDERFGNFAGSIMPMKELYGLMVIGAFLMLTACINFINLATAQSVSRSKEIGVRKVMGSMRKQLIAQFLTETFAISVLALLIACVLTEAALPSMQNLFGAKISFSILQNPVILVFMLVLTVVVACLSGFYPALVMSGFSPALAIKNKIKANTGGLGLRKVLVVVQFTITVVLIIGTLVIIKQMQYLRERPIGFNPSAIAMVDVPSDSISTQRYDVLKQRIMQMPGVKSVSFCSAAPSSLNNNGTSFSYNGSKDADFDLNTKMADENYFKTFGLEMVAGRTLSKSDTIKEFVVNETLLKKLNVLNPNDAIGKIMRVSHNFSGPIVGVVKDFNNNTLRDAISPIAIMSHKKTYTAIAVKMDSKSIMQTMKDIEKTWNSVYPEYVYGSSFLDDVINNYYQSEKIMGILFKVFAGVIIFISFIGLFGLISFVATQRTKEVAIRKVLGASTFELVKMLNGSFLLMVFIANLVAWPLAYLFVSKWLNGFAYRVDLSIWPFVLAMCISMFITLITVSIRSYKAARANTIDALKYE
ncbi:ABC transporter permease [Pedobacter sp. KR3-3]|uniref:ABC transporter permease n=1 Tax=Pedobacter albus TaxID=3113905 RepID=A0ABU7I6E5_9SPHI|nr:ABC transporter permease [Pedobacter sp. KR3-3]MEE1944814.1 ABC transporter permease [Pedobacter sp. KR3-3]